MLVKGPGQASLPPPTPKMSLWAVPWPQLVSSLLVPQSSLLALSLPLPPALYPTPSSLHVPQRGHHHIKSTGLSKERSSPHPSIVPLVPLGLTESKVHDHVHFVSFTSALISAHSRCPCLLSEWKIPRDPPCSRAAWEVLTLRQQGEVEATEPATESLGPWMTAWSTAPLSQYSLLDCDMR